MIRIILLSVLLLVGCSASSNEGLQVGLESDKTTVEAFEPIIFSATVLYNGELVEDGVEIDFEFIHPNGHSIGVVTPTNAGEGLYSIETSFDFPGTYIIISHVSYENTHEMPQVGVTLK